jgi:hypothetical protein
MLSHRCVAFLASLLSVAPAVAQARLAEVAPTLAVGSWLQGEPLVSEGEAAPKAMVLAFYVRPDQAPHWSTDADYLVLLQQRFAKRGVAVVALGADDKVDRKPWPGVRIAVDAEGATTSAFHADMTPAPRIAVLDAERRVTFLGTPDSGLVDAIEATLGKSFDFVLAARAQELRQVLAAGFDDVVAPAALEQLTITAQFPRDGLLLGLEYLVLATKANHPVAAGEVLERALAALAAEPQPLATFADLALRGDPRRPGLVAKLRPALQAAVAACPNDAVLHLAHLRCLVLAGDGREVGRAAMKVRKLTQPSAALCLDFASVLTLDENAPAHRDLATLVVERAQALGAELRLVTAARYSIAGRCANDVEAQKRLLDEHLADEELRASLNNACWYLMTELPTMGRFDLFAAGLAERMLEQKEGMDDFEFDTAALAMFLVGRIEEAIALQKTALQKGGQGNLEYRERLERYRAAQLPAPR